MRGTHALHSVVAGNPMVAPRTATAVLPSSRSTALTILGGAGLAALSFWLTLHALEYFQSPWEPIHSNTILTFGDATASAISFSKDARFKFTGNGHVEIRNTKELQCLKFNCNFSLAVTFAPTQSIPQLIIGQSFAGELGWHLLVGGGRMVLLPDGGATEVAAAFSPNMGQRYKIDIVRDKQEVKLSVNDIVVARSSAMPFTDLARDLTIGGRGGPHGFAFSGTIGEVQIARERSQH